MLYLQTTNVILNNIQKINCQEGGIDVLFRKARNSEEADECPYIQIPKGDTKVKTDSFSNCYDLEYLIIPEGLIKIDNYSINHTSIRGIKLI